MATNKTSLKAPTFAPLSQTFKYFTFLNHKLAMIIIGIVGFTFYITSINGEYALDDGIIIHQNDHVIKGVRGIKDIMTRDAYESFYRRMCATDQLAGGRYRPLSVVSFAIEQEIIGSYRTGLYMKVEDSNHNGVLDKDMVSYTSPCGRPETNYEYNDFVDQNGDGQAQPNECYNCWDLNKNFKNEWDEDLNVDGIFNEVDCQVYGANVRHFNNIWTFALGCMLLYLVFSRYFFRTNQDLAFLAALLFTMHPIHSEAIANVKSRDEIFSLIFISLTFFYVFRYLELKKSVDIFWSCLMFLLALLSKEYAVFLLFLVPLAVYHFTENDFDIKKFFDTKEFRQTLFVGAAFTISAFVMLYLKRDFDMHAPPGAKPIKTFWLFPFMYILVGIFLMGNSKKNNFHKLLSWFYFVLLFYLAMRLVAVKLKPGVPDTEILNNPYLLANGQERFATKGYVLLKYLILQVFPHPLSSDYSYNTIEYRHFTSWDFILSMVIHLGMVYFAVKLILKKHILGFALATYIIFALMIGNVLMDIGATMGERLIFHSSIGFCIAMAYGILWGLDKLTAMSFNLRKASLMFFVLVVTFLYGCKTWERNWDWKNDVTLFLKDVKTMPHSVLVLGNAGARWVDLADTKEVTGVQVVGQDSTRFNDYNGTLKITDEEVKEGGFKNKREAALNKGIKFLKHAVELHPRYVNGYLNLGLASFKLRNDFDALYYWKNAERLYPNNPYLRNYYSVFANDLKSRGITAFNRGRMDSAAMAYNKWTILTPGDAEAWYNLGGAYFNQQKFALAKKSWERALMINPNYNEVKQVLQRITPQMLGQQMPQSVPVAVPINKK
ncbi:MAG: tetratricopeptide repeat protein [Bacteroidia bacterium]|nr:tetratricopeptide repeat protein [Bacteroidia bacterium]